MTQTNGLAIAAREDTGSALAIWNHEQIDVIKNLICPGASDSELALFGQVCQRTGLDPFSRQIYGLMRKTRAQVNGEWTSVERLSIQTSIDGFRLIAQRSKEYAGQDGPYWCGEDGVWRDVWLSKMAPSAAKVGVYRTGWTRPVTGIATWNEYAQTTREGKSTGQWASMPAHMLAKCAEALALRKAFPAELSSLYSGDEMTQADRPAPVEQEPMHPAPAPISGEVIDLESEATWPEPHESKWQAGVRIAKEIGATIPNKPAAGPERSAALSELAANVKARQGLLAELTDVVQVANEIANEEMFAIPDAVDAWPDEDIRKQIADIQQTIATAQAA